jgi:hypothetical protein
MIMNEGTHESSSCESELIYAERCLTSMLPVDVTALPFLASLREDYRYLTGCVSCRKPGWRDGEGGNNE